MYSLIDVMEMLQIPERTIRRHIKEEILVGTKIGGVWRFTKDDIVAYINNKKVQKYIKDDGFKMISDHYSGFVEDKNTVIYILIKEFKEKSNLERFMEVSNLFQNNFSLKCHYAIDSYRFTFKGKASDVLILMKWSEGFEENI